MKLHKVINAAGHRQYRQVKVEDFLESRHFMNKLIVFLLKSIEALLCFQ